MYFNVRDIKKLLILIKKKYFKDLCGPMVIIYK